MRRTGRNGDKHTRDDARVWTPTSRQLRDGGASPTCSGTSSSLGSLSTPLRLEPTSPASSAERKGCCTAHPHASPGTRRFAPPALSTSLRKLRAGNAARFCMYLDSATPAIDTAESLLAHRSGPAHGSQATGGRARSGGSGCAATKLPQPPDLPPQRPPLLDPVGDDCHDPLLSEGSLGRSAGRRLRDQSRPRYSTTTALRSGLRRFWGLVGGADRVGVLTEVQASARATLCMSPPAR